MECVKGVSNLVCVCILCRSEATRRKLDRERERKAARMVKLPKQVSMVVCVTSFYEGAMAAWEAIVDYRCEAAATALKSEIRKLREQADSL